jgi:hypothetical protein
MLADDFRGFSVGEDEVWHEVILVHCFPALSLKRRDRMGHPAFVLPLRKSRSLRQAQGRLFGSGCFATTAQDDKFCEFKKKSAAYATALLVYSVIR